jgi:DNA primase
LGVLGGGTRLTVCIGKELVEAVRELSHIEHIVAEHVELRRSGVQLIGRCPFHADKSPSFYVHPAKGVFYCHGCSVGGDVFAFVQRLHDCSFRQSIEFLASRAGMRIDNFKLSREWTAKMSAREAQRKKQAQFARFCDERIAAINQRHRALGRAAAHAEDCLRAGESDPYIQELAWSASERFRNFQIQIEREGLCDLDILKSEWEQREVA